jgi:hypothetical protein
MLTRLGLVAIHSFVQQRPEGKTKRGEKEPVISRIIARCKIEGTNEWEYLVHYKGRAESENRWVRSSQMDLPPHLKKRYRNTLKMRVTKKNVREPPTPEVRASLAISTNHSPLLHRHSPAETDPQQDWNARRTHTHAQGTAHQRF